MSASLERSIYFFMAYLAKAAAEEGLDVPLNREAYRVVQSNRMAGQGRDLHIALPLASGLTVPVVLPFHEDGAPTELAQSAEELFNQLRTLHADEAEIVELHEELSAHAKSRFRKLRRDMPAVQFKSLELDFPEYVYNQEPVFRLSYEALAADTSLELRNIRITSPEEIDAELRAVHADQLTLTARAKELTAEKADGAIDAVLYSRLKRHGVKISQVFKPGAVLQKEPPLQLPDGEIKLFWHEGILTGNLPLEDGIDWLRGQIRFKNGPRQEAADVTEREVATLIRHPDLPDDLKILEGRSHRGRLLWVEAELQYLMFTKRGRVW